MGFLPVLLFLAPDEELGCSPMPASAATPAGTRPSRASRAREAVRTPAFWLLMLYTVLVYPVQAGVSLHQAPHLVERGLDATTAALIVSGFSLMCGARHASACAFCRGWLPIRFLLAPVGLLLALGHLRADPRYVRSARATSLPACSASASAAC